MAVAEALESYVRGSIAVVVNTSLNACKEVFKFMLILLILYYFAIWSFQFLEDVLQALHDPDKPSLESENKNLKQELDIYLEPNKSDFTSENKDLKIELGSDIDIIQIGNNCIRIGQPDENLLRQNPSLLEQLEIEAEFEENLMKVARREDIDSVNDREKDLFIAQVKQEINETSRASQTNKTSLGKKSKLKEIEPAPSKAYDDENKLNIIDISNIKREPSSSDELYTGETGETDETATSSARIKAPPHDEE